MVPFPARGRTLLAAIAIFTLGAAAPGIAAPPEAVKASQAERTAELLIAKGIGAARSHEAPAAPKLGSDAALVEIARVRSQAMANGDPFSHTDARGHFVAGDMMQDRFGPSGSFGENIAEAYDSRGFDPKAFAKQMVEGWMNSPGHRKNILSPDFTMSGIGVSVRGGHAFATEVFMGPPPSKNAAREKRS